MGEGGKEVAFNESSREKEGEREKMSLPLLPAKGRDRKAQGYRERSEREDLSWWMIAER